MTLPFMAIAFTRLRMARWVVVAAAACLSSCVQIFMGLPPGEGPDAMRWKQDCAPIIEALSRYYADKKDYPAELVYLVPEYLPSINIDEERLPRLMYIRHKNYYKLRFSAFDGASDTCSYATGRDWECSGAY